MPARKPPAVSLASASGSVVKFTPKNDRRSPGKSEPAALIKSKADAPDRPPVSPSRAADPQAQRAPGDVAEAAIRKARSIGYRASAMPTPERLLRAAGDARLEMVHEVVEVADGDKFKSETVEVARVVVTVDSFTRACQKGRMHRQPERNAVLCMAGIRYRSAWRGAGLDGLRGRDLERIGSGGATGLLASEAAAAAFREFARLKEAIPRDFRDAVETVVLQEAPAYDAGRRALLPGDKRNPSTVGMALLRLGLDALARAAGLLPPEIDLTDRDALRVAAE